MQKNCQEEQKIPLKIDFILAIGALLEKVILNYFLIFLDKKKDLPAINDLFMSSHKKTKCMEEKLLGLIDHQKSKSDQQ